MDCCWNTVLMDVPDSGLCTPLLEICCSTAWIGIKFMPPVPCSDYPTFQDAWDCLSSWGSHVVWYVGIAEASWMPEVLKELLRRCKTSVRLFIFRSKVFLRCNLSWAHCDWIVQVTIHDPSINKLSQVHRAGDIPIIGTDDNYPRRLRFWTCWYQQIL
jgi:hypothetical protein